MVAYVKTLYRLAALFLVCALLFSFTACGGTVTHTSRTYAMGTYVTVTEELEHGVDGDLSALLFPLLRETEALLSHKLDGSVPDLLNGLGYAVIPNGSRTMLAEALRLSEEIKEKTGGLFSVSVLPITSLWNFNAEHPTPPSSDAILEALAEMEGSSLVLEGDTVRKTGGDIDLGAIGKGYAASVLASALPKGKSALISVGGSIAAIGTKSSGDAWRVGVRDPFSASKTQTLGTLFLKDAFVSTSGSYEKCFTYEGKSYHHILDPHTGMPFDGDLVSVTVVAGKGTLSDILSTACFLVGSEEAFRLAREYDAAVIAVKTDGTLLVDASLREIFVPRDGWEPVYR